MPSDGQPRAFVLAEHPQHGLLLLRSPGKPKKGKPAHYQLPGGRVDATDASPAAAAARELLEETGLRVLPARLVRIRVDGVVQRSYFHLQLADADAASVLGGDTAPLSGEEWRLALSHEHDAYYFEPHLDEAANAVALHSGGKNSLAVQVLWQSRGRPGGAVKTPPFPDLIKKFCCLPE